MADTRPTKLSFVYKAYLCFLVLVSPNRLVAEEKKDEERKKAFLPQEENEHRAYIVRRAFWSSLCLIVVFGLIGVAMGLLLQKILGQPSRGAVNFMQISGASLLLWGTLFIRGWEIQTFCGVTLVERVNQWIYRCLYCLGTSIIVASLVWPK